MFLSNVYMNTFIWIYTYHGQQKLNVREIMYQIITDFLWIAFEYTVIFKLKIYNSYLWLISISGYLLSSTITFLFQQQTKIENLGINNFLSISWLKLTYLLSFSTAQKLNCYCC